MFTSLCVQGSKRRRKTVWVSGREETNQSNALLGHRGQQTVSYSTAPTHLLCFTTRPPKQIKERGVHTFVRADGTLHRLLQVKHTLIKSGVKYEEKKIHKLKTTTTG